MYKRPVFSKLFAFIAFTFLTLQSCKVYEAYNSTEDEAVSSGLRVKVETIDGKTYKFKRLLSEGDQLVGLAKSNSLAAKEMPSRMIPDSTGLKGQKIALVRENIKEIHVQDPKKSKRRTVGLVVGLTLGTILLAALVGTAVATAALLSY